MQKDFITVTPDSGSGNATITVAVSKNQTENSRTSKMTIAGGGISRTVSLSQSAATKNVITCTASYHNFNQPPTILKISSQYAVKSAVTVQFLKSSGSLGLELTLNKGESNKETTDPVPGGVYSNGTVKLSTVNYESNDNYVYEAVKGW